MARRWLVKTEPSSFSYADLEREGPTRWDGVRNALALIHLRAMRVRDDVLLYHTGREKAVVGVAKVVRGPYPDPQADDPRLQVVDLEAVAPLGRPVGLDELRAEATLADWELLTHPRLSVLPVPARVWRHIRAVARRAAPRDR